MFRKTGISLLHVRTLKINTVMPDISRNARLKTPNFVTRYMKINQSTTYIKKLLNPFS